MSGPKAGLLDTSVVIALGAITDPNVLPELCLISSITLAELSIGPLVATNNGDRRARQAVLQQVESDFHPLPFDDAAARAFGQVAASLQSQGRKPSARAFDALIAATAVANGLALYTKNLDDFAGIDNLQIVQVP